MQASPAAAVGESSELRILQAIRRIIRSIGIYSREIASESGITIPQLSCLLRLVDSGSLTLKELSKEVNLTPSTLVGIIDRLESKGLVQRNRSQTDRRKVLLTATEAGKILAARSPSPLQDRLTRALGRLPQAERLSIAEALEKIVDLMQIHEIDAGSILDTEVSLSRNQTGQQRVPVKRRSDVRKRTGGQT